MDEKIGDRVPKFNAGRNEDFKEWAFRFEALCEAKEMEGVIYSDAVGEADVTSIDETTRQKVRKGRLFLTQALGARALRTVASERVNPYKMYRKLEERYATKKAASRVQLQTELHRMQYNSSITMGEFVDDLESVFAKLETKNCPISESLQVAILLSSFGTVDESPYGPVVSALQTMADEDLTWDVATTRLLQEDSSGQALTYSSYTSAVQVKKEARVLKSLARVKCFDCSRYGHYARNCKAPRRKNSTPRHNEPHVHFERNNQSDNGGGEQALMAQ